MSYFRLVPRDLIFESSLYLNHPETVSFVLILTEGKIATDSTIDDLWDTKINNELNILKEQYLPTAIPREWKYVELKSIRGVDYGSEYFSDLVDCFNRSCRMRNLTDGLNLTKYFMKVFTRYSVKDQKLSDRMSEFVISIIQGATAVGNEELVRYARELHNNPTEISNAIETGLVEASKNIEVVTFGMLKGIIAGDNIGALIKYINLYGASSLDQFPDYNIYAIKMNSYKIVNYIFERYTKRIRNSLLCTEYIQYVCSYIYMDDYYKYIDLCLDIISSNNVNLNEYYDDIFRTASAGSIAIIRDLMNKQVYSKISMNLKIMLLELTLARNHLDEERYIRSADSSIKDARINYLYAGCLPYTFDYIYQNKFIDMNPLVVYKHMENLNPLLAQYIKQHYL